MGRLFSGEVGQKHTICLKNKIVKIKNILFLVVKVSMSSTLNVRNFARTLFRQLLLHTCIKKKAAEMTFVRKMRVFNVDEID